MNYEYCDGYTYTIKKGDTLYEISRSHKVPLSLLLRSNPFVDVFNLQVGDTLCIPTRQAPPKPCEMWGDCEDSDGRPEMPGRPGMPGKPERPNVPGMPENSGRPGASGMPENTERSGASGMPENTGRSDMSDGTGTSGTSGMLQPSETRDEDEDWERYVVRPGDTMHKVLGGRMEHLRHFGEKNGWDHVYLLPGVAHYVPRRY